jgi:hypothetical protein
VTIINTEGLVLFGPGSEWLWFMLQFAAISLTGIAVYRQFRAQRAGNAFAQIQALEEQWRSERMRSIKLRLAQALKGGNDPDTDLLAGEVMAFFDQLDFLYRRGFVETGVLFGYSSALGEDVARWWSVLEGTVRRAQEEYGAQEAAGFERLAVQARTWMAANNAPPFKTDPESIASRLDWIIDGQTRALRIEREIREGMSSTPSPAPPEE